jgi:hypothetical protein
VELVTLWTLWTAAATRPAAVARAELVGTATAGLANRELGNGPCGRLLTVGPRKRRAYQRPVDGPVVSRVVSLVAPVLFLVDFGRLLDRLKRRIDGLILLDFYSFVLDGRNE